MKIGIIGLGFVGTAVSVSHRSDTLILRDPKLGEKSASVEEIKTCDAIYICVPTPMMKDGRCDDSYVRSVLEEIQGYERVIICKSTLPPSVYDELNKTYLNLVHSPEFLTAANATNDYLNSRWILIGGDTQWVAEAAKIIRSSWLVASTYFETDIKTAAFFKYIANSFLAAKVTFMNEMYELAGEMGVSWSTIKSLAENDARLGNTHWDVPGPDGKFGYGGACFPKDVAAIISEAKDHNVDLSVLEQVQKINHEHRKKPTL